MHVGNYTTLPLAGQGKVEILLENGKTICLTNTLYVLDLQKNLSSISDYDEYKSGIFIKKPNALPSQEGRHTNCNLSTLQ